MLQWFLEHLPFKDKQKTQETRASAFATTSSASANLTEPLQKEKPIARADPVVVGSLPDDFWTVLRYYPYTVESCRLDEIRKTPEYAVAKRRYEAEQKRIRDEQLAKQRHRDEQLALERQRGEESCLRLSAELIEVYYEDFEHDDINGRESFSTTVESQPRPLSSTRGTSHRPP